MKIQAHTMRPATPQRTFPGLEVDPTPTMAPVMVWVVETGIPIMVATKIATEPPVSAQKPPKGRSLVSRMPMVFTIAAKDNPFRNVVSGREVVAEIALRVE